MVAVLQKAQQILVNVLTISYTKYLENEKYSIYDYDGLLFDLM